MRDELHEYILENITLSNLTHSVLLHHSSELMDIEQKGFFEVQPQVIELNFGLFVNLSPNTETLNVAVSQTEKTLILSCSGNCAVPKLCKHQVQVLYNLIDRESLRIFFDPALRQEKIRPIAKEYGLENEKELDTLFKVDFSNRSIEIKPKVKELFSLTPKNTGYIKELLFPKNKNTQPDTTENKQTIIVFGKHKYYDHFNVQLFEASFNKDGKIKNPLHPIDSLDRSWKAETIEEVKFYAGISKFQNVYAKEKKDSDLEGLKAIVKNPLNLPVYTHEASLSEKINAASLSKINLELFDTELILTVNQKDPFYEVSGEIILRDQSYPLKTVLLKYDYFIQLGNSLYLITNLDYLRVIDFFKKNNQIILIHQTKYEEFKQTILGNLEQNITIRYSYIKPATKKQLREQGFENTKKKILYLSEEDRFISITPVILYGNIEIPVFSRKQIHDTDQNGNIFVVDRDEALEIQFTALLARQHPDFHEQLQDHEYFYLHKDKFLNDEWFLNAFEEWRNHDILILGFNEIKNNKLNPHKGTVSIQVSSGVDWFNTDLTVTYGKQKAALKQLHKSIRHKSKYVQLDDGTLGILPEEWIQKFSKYFQQGDIVGEQIRTSKNNFSEVLRIYDEQSINKEAKEELDFFHKKFTNEEISKDIEVPKELNATLREYQKQGLNWLNRLDQFNFGGCLADDMGLGKTIQIIAFILSQRSRQKQNTNLIVVPTSLLFNWQEEVKKFAPSLKLFTNYGSGKLKTKQEFDQYEIVLTTYGMLLSDIGFLKEYRFNYIFLDESQAIKNPESQRYKAATMLQSRNKIVLTGTPVENNTFDLYGQLSFACPGLLGNKQYFKDIYSIPIDRFDDKRRAKELQQKISPFILRRTKKQVATELPEKTEMVLYCEMGEEQRQLYNVYEKNLRDFISSKNEDEIPKNSMHVLKGITKLRQLCNSPALLKDEHDYGSPSSKIEVLIEQITQQAPQHKILVFSQFVSMLEIIKKALDEKNITYEYLTGQTKNRADKVNSFQTNAEVRVFLISLKAGGTGLNLTEADYVYLVDPWWNPAVENQAIDRSYRIGQTKNVIAVRLICPDTIEAKISKLQESKTKLANDLVKSEASFISSFSKKDLMAILQ